MTQYLLPMLILFFYPDAISYLIDLIYRIICNQDLLPRDLWKLFFQSNRTHIVMYGLVKVHDDVHKPILWINSQLEYESTNLVRVFGLHQYDTCACQPRKWSFTIFLEFKTSVGETSDLPNLPLRRRTLSSHAIRIHSLLLLPC